MPGQNTKDGKPSNGGEGARKNGHRRKKRSSDGTVSRRSDGPLDTVVNGVFLKSVRPEDTKALSSEDWKKVRDYVINERKKLAEKNGPTDDNGIKNARAEDEVGDSNDGKRSESKKSHPEHTSASAEANVATYKSNGSTKKKKANLNSRGGPTNVTINGVCLKSIRVEDTKALSPADWQQVRDYVLYERKKVSDKNGTNEDHNLSQLDSVSTDNVSVEATSAVGDSEVKSPPANAPASTDSESVTASKSNRSKKKKKGETGRKDANSLEPVKDSVSDVVDGKQNSSPNNSRAKGKNHIASQNFKQKPAKSGDEIEQVRGKPKKSPAKRDSAAIDLEYLSAQLRAETEQRLAADEQAKLERGRADRLAKQVTSLDQELKRVTKAFEKSNSEGKRHLVIQLKLLEATKKELHTVNTSLCLEQSKVMKLKSKLVLEMTAKESCAKELDRMKDIVAFERKMMKDLRKELSHATTLRAERAEQSNVVKLKSQLVLETAAKESCTKELDRLNGLVASERQNVKNLQEELSHTKTLRSENVEQSNLSKLKSQLVLEIAAKESCTKELDRMKDLLASERKMVKNLREELSHSTAVNKSMKQELSDNILGADRLEQSNVSKLKSQLVLEMAAEESCTKELDKMKDLVASERKKVEDLQKELSHITTANKSMKQELNENKLRAEKVKKLELELREERAKIAKLGNNPPKATLTLRKELHETQEKLKNAKKRNAVLTSELSKKSYPQRQQQTGYISQRERLGSDGEASRNMSLEVASPKRAMSMPAPVEVSLSERASLVNFESAPVHYDGVVVDNDGDAESSGVQDELTFIRSAFSSDEISVDDNQVTYTLQLPVDGDSEDVKINVSVVLPARYPSVRINDIKVAVNEKSTCCPEIRKIALDALPTVQQICLIEARAREGSASLSSIFSVADMWAKDDWHGVMAKQLSLPKGKGKFSKIKSEKGSFEICTFLIYTHHILDPDKIQLVKKSASKLNLCGFMKIGKPGLILVEGPQSDCEALMETLLLTRKKRKESHGGKVDSATFMAAGNVVRKAMTSCERMLPKKLEQLESKDGMDKIKDACKKSGLLGSLEEVCKR